MDISNIDIRKCCGTCGYCRSKSDVPGKYCFCEESMYYEELIVSFYSSCEYWKCITKVPKINFPKINLVPIKPPFSGDDIAKAFTRIQNNLEENIYKLLESGDYMGKVNTGNTSVIKNHFYSEALIQQKLDEFDIIEKERFLEEHEKIIREEYKRELLILRRLTYTYLDTTGMTVDELSKELSNKKFYLMDREDYNELISAKRRLNEVKKVLGVTVLTGNERNKNSNEAYDVLHGNRTIHNCYRKYRGNSVHIREVFDDVGVPRSHNTSWQSRKMIAKINGIPDYTGDETENLLLISLAKKGRLKKV